MAVLKSGTLSKLIEDMNADKKGSENFQKPVLLQIRSIIPALEKDDLWPNRGFYLKVSDLTHATFVSLPHEQDEMILSNKLQLGQLIYVQKLEAALPVPVLRSVMPVSGRRSCEGTPEDILPVNNLVKFLGATDTEVVKDKGVISEKKTENNELSECESLLDDRSDPSGVGSEGKLFNLSSRKTLSSEQIIKALTSDTKLEEPQRNEFSFVENDTDYDSPKSTISSSTQMSKRRSWNTTELLDVKAIFDSSVAKHETRTRPHSRGVCISPVRSMRVDSSDDNATLARSRRSTISSTKSVQSSTKSIPPGSRTRCEACPKALCSQRMVEESKIKWDSFPWSLMKLGKDMVKHRDIATLAAVEALQEACTAEKLINCLSIYSEIKSVKGNDDPQPVIHKFFELQDCLSQTRHLLQSLTNITPLRTPDSDINSPSSIKEVLNLAVERKKTATACIKSAISSDLSPCPCSLSRTKKSNNLTKAERKTTNSAKRDNCTPKISCMVRKEKTNCEIKGSDRAQPSDWVKGSSFREAADLTNELQNESQKYFLGYVEKFLDEVEMRIKVIDSDMKIALMMSQIKRVNDWLDGVSKDGCWVLDDAEVEACGRVRNKIYSVLLKHVEKTAMALENMSKPGQKF